MIRRPAAFVQGDFYLMNPAGCLDTVDAICQKPLPAMTRLFIASDASSDNREQQELILFIFSKLFTAHGYHVGRGFLLFLSIPQLVASAQQRQRAQPHRQEE
jgi:hypothetical protein